MPGGSPITCGPRPSAGPPGAWRTWRAYRSCDFGIFLAVSRVPILRNDFVNTAIRPRAGDWNALHCRHEVLIAADCCNPSSLVVSASLVFQPTKKSASFFLPPFKTATIQRGGLFPFPPKFPSSFGDCDTSLPSLGLAVSVCGKLSPFTCAGAELPCPTAIKLGQPPTLLFNKRRQCGLNFLSQIHDIAVFSRLLASPDSFAILCKDGESSRTPLPAQPGGD